MKHRGQLFVIGWLAIATSWFSVAPAQEPPLAMAHHPWARFGIGSTKTVRTKIESYDAHGKLEGAVHSETKSTLIDVTDTNFTIEVEATVETGAKRFPSERKQITQGFYGESKGQTLEVKTLGPGEVVIGGKPYPSEIRQIVINGDSLRRVSLLHVNERIMPFVLRRETHATDAASKSKTYDSVVEVLSVNEPLALKGRNRLVSQVKTIYRPVDGPSTTTLELHCDEVPGGVVSSTTTEELEDGRLVRRQTAELVDFQVVTLAAESALPNPPQSRRRLMFRNRGRTAESTRPRNSEGKKDRS